MCIRLVHICRLSKQKVLLMRENELGISQLSYILYLCYSAISRRERLGNYLMHNLLRLEELSCVGAAIKASCFLICSVNGYSFCIFRRMTTELLTAKFILLSPSTEEGVMGRITETWRAQLRLQSSEDK